MLTLAEFRLQTGDGRRLSANAGSVLQGLLVEQIDGALATHWHRPGLRPYSQHLLPCEGGAVWRIAALQQAAHDQIITPLLAEEKTSFLLKQKQLDVRITGRTLLSSLSYGELTERYFLSGEETRRVLLRFATPTSFKSDNSYMIYPSVQHIIGSLYQKWNAFAAGVSFEDEQALQHLIQHIRIADYQLRMSPFSLEKVKIPAFVGEVELRLSGPGALVRLADVLLAFANFSGIGIKTALGMGGCQTAGITAGFGRGRQTSPLIPDKGT